MTTAVPPQGTRELAEHYGISLETARRWLRQGTVHGRKLPSGSRWRIAPDALQEPASLQVHEPTAEVSDGISP